VNNKERNNYITMEKTK